MLTLQNTDAIRRIEAAIGYTFRDKRLLVQVFTRKTYMKVDPEAPDNEVLEFYGDMLMSYHVTTYFIEKFAHMLNDGLYFMRTVEQFTEMRSHYVRNQYLTERIKQLLPNIDKLVRAQNPRVELPKDNQKAYADLFESLVGAVYLDSYRDDDLIRAFILRHLVIEPKAEPEAPTRSTRSVTVLPPVSLIDKKPEPAPLQTEAFTEIEPLPEAELPAEKAPELLVEAPTASDATAVVEEVPAAAEEVPAPTEALAAPAEIPPAAAAPEAFKPDVKSDVSTTMQDELAAFCREAGYEAPVYGETPKNAPHARPVAACTVRFRNKRGKPVKISLNDSGKTLAEATEKAAVKMLKKLREQQEADRAPEVKPAEMRAAEAESAETDIPALEKAPSLIDAPVDAVISAHVEDTPTEVVPEATDTPEVATESIPEAEAATEAADARPAEPAEAVEAVPEATEVSPAEAPAAEIIIETVAETAAETVTVTEEKPASRRRRASAKSKDMPAEQSSSESKDKEPAAETAQKPAEKQANGKKSAEKKPSVKKSKAPKSVTPESVDAAVAAPAEVETEAPPAAPKKPRRRAPAKAVSPAPEATETVKATE